MRTRIHSIVAAFVLLSLVSGAIGCRSNGGPWYNPKTYSFHNPFKSNEAPLFESEGSAQVNNRPSMGAVPDVNVPPGGYVNKEAESSFLAGSKDKAVMTQYDAAGIGSPDANRMASANGSAASSAYPGSSYPGNSGIGYEPYPTTYQQTTLHSAGAVPPPSSGYGNPLNTPPVADPMVYPGAVPSGMPGNPVSNNVMPGDMTNPMSAPSAAENYAPFGAPTAGVASIYGDPANPLGAPMNAQPAAAQPMNTQPQGFGAMPQDVNAAPAAPQGFGQIPPQHPGTVNPYMAAPSAYPASAPQGF